MVNKVSDKNLNSSGTSIQQVENFTNRINSINKHLSSMKKDHHSRKGLLDLVSKRRKLLNYLKRKNSKEYLEIVKKLNLRK